MILPADKGRTTVILDKAEYLDKMKVLLSDTNTYSVLKKDPTNKFKNKLLDMLRKWEKDKAIPRDLYWKIKPQADQVPRAYGLPKVHKANRPLRPIVASMGTITYRVAKYLASVLSPLVGKTNHFILNSEDFTKKIADLSVPPGQVLISYDVSSLFTCIPTQDALSVIKDRLENDNTLHERTPLTIDMILQLMSFCLETTYFQFDNMLYQQCHGAAMGSPISPLVANLYMESFEQKAIATAPTPPDIWLRYVDDTFVKIREDSVDEFTEHINNIDPNIKFTHEHPVDGKLAFLDTCVHILDDGGTKVTIYRKPTHTDQYLGFESHHPLEHKRSVVRTLLHRAKNIVSQDDDKQKEVKHVKAALRANGYKEWVLNIPQRPLPMPSSSRQTSGPTIRRRSIGLPYIQGLSEHLQRVFKNSNIQVYHKPTNTLRQMLVHPKDSIELERKCDVIYEIKCPSCESTYVGETCRSFGQRFKEHCKTEGPAKSITAIGDHINRTGHVMDSKFCKILDTAEDYYPRKIKEALYIQERSPNMNRDRGLELPRI
jgi:hypothetical protein